MFELCRDLRVIKWEKYLWEKKNRSNEIFIVKNILETKKRIKIGYTTVILQLDRDPISNVISIVEFLVFDGSQWFGEGLRFLARPPFTLFTIKLSISSYKIILVDFPVLAVNHEINLRVPTSIKFIPILSFAYEYILLMT